MKAISLTQPSLDAFRPTTLAERALGPQELRIRLHAASLNFIDLAIASGAYPPPEFPLVPVCDGAGTVVEVGCEVRSFAIGDRVVPHAKPAWIGGPPSAATVDVMRGVGLVGSLAERVVVPENSVVRLPEHLDFEQGATLPIAATTAWNALRSAAVRPGSRVLLLGTGASACSLSSLRRPRGHTSRSRRHRTRSSNACERSARTAR